MDQIHYMTLANARRVDPVAFDSAVKLAIKQAASDVGDQVMIQALCKPQQIENKKISLAA